MTKDFVRMTAKEFADLQAEAESVANVLPDAHAELTRYQKRARTLTDQARKEARTTTGPCDGHADEDGRPVSHVDPFRAPEVDAGDAGRGGGRRPWLVAGVAAGVLALSGAVVAAVWFLDASGGSGPDDRLGEAAADARWAEGITPEWMSEQMGLDIPVTAHSPQAAYEVTSRFDTGLLPFTLTREEAETYLKAHPPEGMWLEPTAEADVPPHDFAHFDLPEPETIEKGMWYGYVCPSADQATEDPDLSGMYGTSDKSCVSLYAHEYSHTRTRIYLRDHYDPGISPLPTPPSMG
ncbi:hypothetical protein ACWDUK_05625 [Streptomyces cellulosae]